ncbi:MAG TPA: nitroreductase family protein [Xanthobacteraceae bacterium]|nr:nitroreductase family protein [Xanthobacteraceae bacterium]
MSKIFSDATSTALGAAGVVGPAIEPGAASSLQTFAGETFAELVMGRRSIRRYQLKPVEAALLDRILTRATWAPSAHNRQPWRFAVVARTQRRGLADAMAMRLKHDRLADGDDPAIVAADVARSVARLVDAPALVLVCLTMAEMDRYADTRRAQAEFLMAVQSTAMAVQNLLLAARHEGLGSCVLCAPLFCPDVVVRTLDLPADWQPQCLITLGWPANTGKPANRRPLSEVLAPSAARC